MIAVFGEAITLLKENRYGLYEKSITGRGYEAAVALAASGDFPLFITGLGEDAMGSEVCEDLVCKQVLFDSDLALLKLDSPVVIEKKDGRRLEFVRHSSAMGIAPDVLNNALSMHSDIRAVLLSTPTLSYNPVCSSFLDAALFLDPKVFLAVDAAEEEESPIWKRMRLEAFENADLVRVEEAGMENLPAYKDVLVVTGSQRITVYRKSEKLFERNCPASCERSAGFVAYLLKSLEAQGVFTSTDFLMDKECLKKAVDYALEKLK